MKFSASLTVALVICTLCVPASGAEPDYTRRPILMVHGYFPVDAADWVTWGRFKDKLVEDGWPEEYIMAPVFNETTGCDPDHAREIAAWVDELRERTGWDKVDIIAHSEGGLNTMYYLRYFCGVHKVRNFVGLAIAVHGTRVACVDFVSCGGEEMCIPTEKDGGWRANEVLAAVNACDETLGDIRYTSIWSDKDEIIIPQEGSKLYGARNIQMQTFAEHGLIFLVDESLGYIKDALKNKTGYNTDGPGWDCIPQCVIPDQADSVESPESVESVEDSADATQSGDLSSSDISGDIASDVVETADTTENHGFIVVPYDAGHGDRSVAETDTAANADVVVATDTADAGQDDVNPVNPGGKSGCSASNGAGATPFFSILMLMCCVFAFARRRRERTNQ